MFDHPKPRHVIPEAIQLGPNGRMPNSHLPVLVYRGVLSGDELEKPFRKLFRHNHWGGDWAMGIYGYHHFHSNAHEVLGIAAGTGTLILGGDGGRGIVVEKGDALILPAGTGHRRIKDSWDFWVVGAYPPGQESYDKFTDQALCANCALRLRAVATPDHDPVFGADGPLIKFWQADLAEHAA